MVDVFVLVRWRRSGSRSFEPLRIAAFPGEAFEPSLVVGETPVVPTWLDGKADDPVAALKDVTAARFARLAIIHPIDGVEVPMPHSSDDPLNIDYQLEAGQRLIFQYQTTRRALNKPLAAAIRELDKALVSADAGKFVEIYEGDSAAVAAFFSAIPEAQRKLFTLDAIYPATTGQVLLVFSRPQDGHTYFFARLTQANGSQGGETEAPYKVDSLVPIRVVK